MNYFKSVSIAIPLVIGYLTLSGQSYDHTVVIDPGHGGLSLNPISMHGDKYDPGRQKYLSPYYQGASYKNLHEGEIAWDISRDAYGILKLTQSDSGRKQFAEILQKYGVKTGEIRPVGVHLSREEGLPANLLPRYDGKTNKDYNAPYRLFDFPDLETGERVPGMISRINKIKPSLVVSIHLDSVGPTRGAMAAVVTPGYDTFKKALDYAEGGADERRKIRNEFSAGPYANWIQMNSSRNAFEWFLCDSWIYYTGYWSVRNGLEADAGTFRGLRHDYVEWRYQGDSWEKPGGRVQQSDILDIDMTKPFWIRELSEPERWRREGGPEGIGGDNLYASHEILRFIRMGLLKNKSMNKNELPDIREPHWSTWSVPTYINAVNAFIEIGFLNNRYDRDRIMRFREVHSEAIAVGIYSLLYGLEIPEVGAGMMPRGKNIDFQKYRTWSGGDYFDGVR